MSLSSLSLTLPSFTAVLFGALHASVALDVTTPVERAPTLFGPGELVRVVSATAAQEVAAVRACEHFEKKSHKKHRNTVVNIIIVRTQHVQVAADSRARVVAV